MNIQNLMDKWGVNGNFCAAQNGETLFSCAHGYYDIENRAEYTADTRTYVASVTKQFTAVCIMMLQEKGLIDIDLTLDNYVPEYRFADKVTLRQMLNMTSGIPNELSVIGRRLHARRAEFDMSDDDFERMVSRETAPEKCTPADFLEIVNAEPMEFEPGERFDYSDTNYMLLGHIVERVTGVPYAEFMRINIFEPLGMNRSIVGADHSDGPSYRTFGGKLYNMGWAHFTTGEGSISTTAEDLCKWLNAVLDGKFISAESWKQCFTLVHDTYGFGWHGKGDWFCHGGGDLGYSSMVWINPARKIAMAGAMNMPAGDGKTSFYDELFDMINDGVR